MNTLILQTATRILVPIFFLVVIFVLQRGHNDPGGGFIAGLGATGAIVLYALAFGPAAARQLLRIQPQALIGLGLILAVATGLWPVFYGQPFLTGLWTEELEFPGFPGLALGTPLLFDVAVAMVVVGIGVIILISLLEDA